MDQTTASELIGLKKANSCLKTLTIQVSKSVFQLTRSVTLVESYSGCFTKNGLMDWTAVSIFNAVLRPWWSAAVCSMIILCDLRYGYLINWFLSSKPLLFLSKLLVISLRQHFRLSVSTNDINILALFLFSDTIMAREDITSRR